MLCRPFPPQLAFTSILRCRLFQLLQKGSYSKIMQEARSSGDSNDLIFVRSLNLKAIAGVDSWGRRRPQPVLLSFWLKSSIAQAGSTDHLPYSIHYGTLTKAITTRVENDSFISLEHLAENVANTALGPDVGARWVKVVVEKPRALLRADAAGISITRKRREDGAVVHEGSDKVFVKNLRLVTIIGVNPWEREEAQDVVINLTIHSPNMGCLMTPPLEYSEKEDGHFSPHCDFNFVAKRVTQLVEASGYKTVEALVTAVAREACISCRISKITVRAEKPSALTFAECPGVEITRERSFFLQNAASSTGDGKHEVFIALGSNVGDRFKNIEASLVALEKKGIKVKRTSSLYQSAPMYYVEQPAFLNGVIKIETALSPLDLLIELKNVEKALGREKTVENGPRTIDLDILLYGNQVIETDTLTIPHSRMLEREFVLQPLCDISPDLKHPLTSTSFKHHLSSLLALPRSTLNPRLQTFVSISPHLPPLDPSNPTRPTHIMAVINLTPDSFSDGGTHTLHTVVSTANSLLSFGATILDLGGQSTRPGAPSVGESEEIRRVIPAIKALREAGIVAPVSIDTYRAGVAVAAIEAGADFINDVSAGNMDQAMLPTVATLGVPICLMHMRGTPLTMKTLTEYPSGVVSEVAAELAQRVEAAEAAGIRRWNILLDPGIGFAKTMEQNLEVIRRLGELTAGTGMPWLLGPSRKRFIGAVTGEEVAGERMWGTAGAVAACVAGGADIVRVHDVEEMKKVVDMTVAIWRR